MCNCRDCSIFKELTKISHQLRDIRHCLDQDRKKAIKEREQKKKCCCEQRSVAVPTHDPRLPPHVCSHAKLSHLNTTPVGDDNFDYNSTDSFDYKDWIKTPCKKSPYFENKKLEKNAPRIHCLPKCEIDDSTINSCDTDAVNSFLQKRKKWQSKTEKQKSPPVRKICVTQQSKPASAIPVKNKKLTRKVTKKIDKPDKPKSETLSLSDSKASDLTTDNKDKLRVPKNDFYIVVYSIDLNESFVQNSHVEVLIKSNGKVLPTRTKLLTNKSKGNTTFRVIHIDYFSKGDVLSAELHIDKNAIVKNDGSKNSFFRIAKLQ